MGSAFARQLSGSIVVVVLTALAALLICRSLEVAAIALVGGVAAVLLAPRAVAAAAPPVDEAAARDAGAAELLEAVAEPVLLVRAGRVEIANRAARALLGAHIVGEDARVAIRHPAAAERLARSDASGGTIALAGIGGTDQHWDMRLGAAADGAVVVHLVETTARHAAERMRVDFVANASHELRTPLASILGFVEALADAAGEEPGLRARFLHVMGEEARRMQRLVEDLISLSRIEADKYRAPSTPVDLSALVESVCGELRRVNGTRGEDLDCSEAGAVPAVAGDAAQLSQLLHNLVGNAMKYGRAGLPVRVVLAQEGDMVVLSVADRGDGIPPEHLPRLTERFYRVDAGRSRSLGGTGLGLAIVKHVVERHRGRMDVASRVGEGTTVTVRLPQVAMPAPAPPAMLSQNGNG